LVTGNARPVLRAGRVRIGGNGRAGAAQGGNDEVGRRLAALERLGAGGGRFQGRGERLKGLLRQRAAVGGQQVVRGRAVARHGSPSFRAGPRRKRLGRSRHLAKWRSHDWGPRSTLSGAPLSLWGEFASTVDLRGELTPRACRC